MPEIKKFWPVHDAPEYAGSNGSDYLWTDPDIKSEEHRLAHFSSALEEGGHSLHKMIRIYNGTGQDTWEKENTKVYDDAASARKDAEKRMAKAHQRFERRHPDAKVAQQVVSRFTNQTR